MPTTLLNKHEVGARIRRHPRTIMRMVLDGEFPAPIRLGSHRTAEIRFVESEVENWLAEKIAARDAKSPQKTGD